MYVGRTVDVKQNVRGEYNDCRDGAALARRRMAAISFAMEEQRLREVRIGADYDRSDYRQFQLNYLDPQTRRPIPSTRVYVDGALAVETNSLSCFGPEPDLTKPLVGIFGDSVVQGVGLGSFVNHIDLPSCSVVNGGVEGSLLENTVDRFCHVRAIAPMICAVIHPGFHNLLYNETKFMHWEAQFARLSGVPVVALFRLTADINKEVIERGYEALFGDSYARTHFNKDPPTVRLFAEALERKNRLIEKACENRGYVLIDLDEILAPKDYGQVAQRFFDVIHPEPAMYPAMGTAVAGCLRPYVELALDGRRPPGADRPVTPAPVSGEYGRTYPLW